MEINDGSKIDVNQMHHTKPVAIIEKANFNQGNQIVLWWETKSSWSYKTYSDGTKIRRETGFVSSLYFW